MLYKIPCWCIFCFLRAAINILLWYTLNLVIGLFWAGMELLRYGATRPSYEDTVIGLILCVSLYFNISGLYHFRRFKLLAESWVFGKHQKSLDCHRNNTMRTEKQLETLKALAFQMKVCMEVHKLHRGYAEIYIPLNFTADGETRIISSGESAPLIDYLNSIKAVWRYHNDFGIQVVFPSNGYPEEGGQA